MSRKKLVLLISTLALISVVVFVYIFAFKEVVFVTDDSWNLLEPREEMSRLRRGLFLRGRRLICMDFEDFLSSYKNYTNSCSLLILSPVSSAAAVSQSLLLSSEFSCIVAGLGAEEEYEVFDMVLKSYVSDEIPEDAVDYRFSAYSEGKKVYCPLLSESILPLLGLSKEEIHGTGGVLVYGYR